MFHLYTQENVYFLNIFWLVLYIVPVHIIIIGSKENSIKNPKVRATLRKSDRRVNTRGILDSCDIFRRISNI